MKILLILPFDSTYRFKGAFRRTLSYSPLTLTTLAALVPSELKASITIVDEGVQPETVPAAGFDVVGITCVASSAPRAYRLSQAYRSFGSLTVLGGAHPTLYPEEAAQYADVVVAGPAEGVWPRLLGDFSEKKPLQKIYRNAWQPEGSPCIPARQYLVKGSYLNIPTVIATRGCSNRCKYCSINRLWDGAYSRPVSDVVAEISAIKSRSVLFLDPNIIAQRDYAMELFKGLKPLKRKWAGLATVDLAFDSRLLDAAAESGCIGILAGFESFNQTALDTMGKRTNRVKRYRDAVAILHERSIRVLGCFVLGFDEDTVESLRDIADRSDEIGVDIPRFSVLTPFPGTPLFDKMKSEGRIISEDWSLYDTEHVVFKPARMEPTELEEALKWTWRRSYALTRIFRRTVRNRSAPALTAAINLAFRHYGRRIGNRPLLVKTGAAS